MGILDPLVTARLRTHLVFLAIGTDDLPLDNQLVLRNIPFPDQVVANQPGQGEGEFSGIFLSPKLLWLAAINSGFFDSLLPISWALLTAVMTNDEELSLRILVQSDDDRFKPLDGIFKKGGTVVNQPGSLESEVPLLPLG